MLTAAVPLSERAGAQGASDLVMGLVAGLGGALAGVVVDRASFTVLALVAPWASPCVVGLVAALSAVRTHAGRGALSSGCSRGTDRPTPGA